MNISWTGKLQMPKETDKFNPYTDVVYDSGWENKTIKFNVICGDNRHMLQVRGGAWSDWETRKDKNVVYTLTKSGQDDDGNRIKGESIQVPFKERFDSKWVDQIADYKKYVFDLEKPGRRYNLKKILDELKEGKSPTDEDLKNVGLESESEVEKAYEKSLAKHHEFITEWDFIDFIKKVLDSGKYKDSMFAIRGQAKYQYSEQNDTVYTQYVPQRIYLAADDAEPSSSATLKFYFNKDSFDDADVDNTRRIYINGFQREYNEGSKKDDPNYQIPIQTTIVIVKPEDGADEKEFKKFEAIKKKFIVESDDDTWYEYNCEIDVIDGAQRMKINENDLPDEIVEDLELGLITMEDVIKSMGGDTVYGDNLREYRFVKPGKKSLKGREASAYEDDDFKIKHIDDDDEDLFDETDDDDL